MAVIRWPAVPDPLVSVHRRELPFIKTTHLSNPWNEHKPIKIGRDGQVCRRRAAGGCGLRGTHCSSSVGDRAGRRRSALWTVSAGRERGRSSGGSPHSAQTQNADGAAASRPAAAARTGKVSQSSSSSPASCSTAATVPPAAGPRRHRRPLPGRPQVAVCRFAALSGRLTVRQEVTLTSAGSGGVGRVLSSSEVTSGLAGLWCFGVKNC